MRRILGARGLLRSTGTVVFGSGLSKAALLIGELYLARDLGSSDFGLYSVGFAILLVMAAFSQCGFGHGVIQYLGIHEETGDRVAQARVVRSSMLFVAAVATMAGLSVILLAAPLSVTVFRHRELEPVLRTVGIIIPFEAINLCASAVFRGLRMYKKYIVTLDVCRNASILAYVPLGITGLLDVAFAFRVLLIGTALGAVISILMVWRSLDFGQSVRGDIHEFKRVFRFSLPLMFWQILQTVSNRILLIFCGAFLLAREVGILALALRMSNLLDFPHTAVHTTSAVEFVRLNHVGNRAGLQSLFRSLAMALFAVASVMSIPLILNGEVILRLFGRSYGGHGWVIGAVIVSKALDVGTGPVGQILIACGKRTQILALAIGDTALQVCGVIPLILTFGLAGAVWGNMGRAILIILARHLTLRHLVHVDIGSRSFAKLVAVVVASILTGAVLLTSTASMIYRGLIVAGVEVPPSVWLWRKFWSERRALPGGPGHDEA